MDNRMVMLVEDNPALLSGVREILRESGLPVIGFGSFEAARAYLQHCQPAALVTDVRLGAYNGLHLVILAKQRSPEVAAFVYSAYADLAVREEAARCGAIFAAKEDIRTVLIPALLMRVGQVH